MVFEGVGANAKKAELEVAQGTAIRPPWSLLCTIKAPHTDYSFYLAEAPKFEKVNWWRDGNRKSDNKSQSAFTID